MPLLECEWCGDEFVGRRGSRFDCRECFQAWRGAQVPVVECANPDCDEEVRAVVKAKGRRRAYCSADCSAEHQRGENAPNWKGGTCLDSQGYLRITHGEHNGRREHRVIMEGILGRPLKAWEHVHHIDGDKTNNTLDNLEVIDELEHGELHGDRTYTKKAKKKRNRKRRT